jgi:hypothetical protein
METPKTDDAKEKGIFHFSGFSFKKLCEQQPIPRNKILFLGTVEIAYTKLQCFVNKNKYYFE